MGSPTLSPASRGTSSSAVATLPWTVTSARISPPAKLKAEVWNPTALTRTQTSAVESALPPGARPDGGVHVGELVVVIVVGVAHGVPPLGERKDNGDVDAAREPDIGKR